MSLPLSRPFQKEKALAALTPRPVSCCRSPWHESPPQLARCVLQKSPKIVTNLQGFVSSAMKTSKDTTFALADSTTQLVASALSTGLTMTLVIAVSVFLYGTLYYSYMPVEMVDETLNLGFEPCEGQSADRCSFPSASLAIGRKQQML